MRYKMLRCFSHLNKINVQHCANQLRNFSSNFEAPAVELGKDDETIPTEAPTSNPTPEKSESLLFQETLNQTLLSFSKRIEEIRNGNPFIGSRSLDENNLYSFHKEQNLRKSLRYVRPHEQIDVVRKTVGFPVTKVQLLNSKYYRLLCDLTERTDPIEKSSRPPTPIVVVDIKAIDSGNCLDLSKSIVPWKNFGSVTVEEMVDPIERMVSSDVIYLDAQSQTNDLSSLKLEPKTERLIKYGKENPNLPVPVKSKTLLNSGLKAQSEPVKLEELTRCYMNLQSKSESMNPEARAKSELISAEKLLTSFTKDLSKPEPRKSEKLSDSYMRSQSKSEPISSEELLTSFMKALSKSEPIENFKSENIRPGKLSNSCMKVQSKSQLIKPGKLSNSVIQLKSDPMSTNLEGGSNSYMKLQSKSDAVSPEGIYDVKHQSKTEFLNSEPNFDEQSNSNMKVVSKSEAISPVANSDVKIQSKPEAISPVANSDVKIQSEPEAISPEDNTYIKVLSQSEPEYCKCEERNAAAEDKLKLPDENLVVSKSKVQFKSESEYCSCQVPLMVLNPDIDKLRLEKSISSTIDAILCTGERLKEVLEKEIADQVSKLDIKPKLVETLLENLQKTIPELPKIIYIQNELKDSKALNADVGVILEKLDLIVNKIETVLSEAPKLNTVPKFELKPIPQFHFKPEPLKEILKPDTPIPKQFEQMTKVQSKNRNLSICNPSEDEAIRTNCLKQTSVKQPCREYSKLSKTQVLRSKPLIKNLNKIETQEQIIQDLFKRNSQHLCKSKPSPLPKRSLDYLTHMKNNKEKFKGSTEPLSFRHLESIPGVATSRNSKENGLKTLAKKSLFRIEPSLTGPKITLPSMKENQPYHKFVSAHRTLKKTTHQSTKLGSFQRLCSQSFALPPPTNFVDTSTASNKAEFKASVSGKLLLKFTCKKCDSKNSKTISKHAYTKGVVIVRCDGCSNNHLIADNLNWFTDMNGKKNIEDIMAEKGEKVRKFEGNGTVELVENEK